MKCSKCEYYEITEGFKEDGWGWTFESAPIRYCIYNPDKVNIDTRMDKACSKFEFTIMGKVQENLSRLSHDLESQIAFNKFLRGKQCILQ